jgi:putative ABC transport system permease protein
MERDFSFDLMSAVVALIVGLAGGLALIVLFTLASTNISERVREIATLKVLGFYDREVHAYVNKEMMILTLMGIVVGLPLGRYVGGLLTSVLNMPSLYFEVNVNSLSYVVAAGVTLLFALLVQLFTNPVLDRIDPVSSLKSVE